MRTRTKVCLGCLRQISLQDSVCPYCGFDPRKVVNPRYLQVGTLLHDRYTIGKVIGEGGFGITYVGVDTAKNTPVAIKEYFLSGVAGRDTSTGRSNNIFVYDGTNGRRFEEGLCRFAKEGRILSRLEKVEHVVKVFDYFEENSTGYIVMEYVPGKTVRQRVEREGVFSKIEMFEVIQPLLEDLMVIHKKGLLHRDISPDNIILRPDGMVKLIDFGAARRALSEREEDKSVTIMIRRQYTPKEQYLSRGNLGSWTDIYALCATMYYMLSGVEPVPALEREEQDTLPKLVDLRPDLGNGLSDIIAKGMEILPEKRYQSLEELGDELVSVVPAKEQEMIAHINRTIYVNRDVEGKRYLPLWKKRRRIIGVIVLVVILLSCGVLFGVGRLQNEPESSQDNSASGAATVAMIPYVMETAGDRVEKILKEEIRIEVPDLATKSLKTAKKKLKQCHLTYQIKRAYSEVVTEGYVVSQSPKSGKKVKKGTKLTLTVSKGKKPVVKKTTEKTVKKDTTKQIRIITD